MRRRGGQTLEVGCTLLTQSEVSNNSGIFCPIFPLVEQKENVLYTVDLVDKNNFLVG